jgi:predicted transcriptional regulator
LRELERDNLVFQDKDKDYSLTKIGEIITAKLMDFIDTIEVLKRHETFWSEHDLSGIPEHLLEKIGWLKNSTVTECSATDVFKVYYKYLDMLKDAKEIKGVSSMFFPEYPPLIFQELTLKKRVDIQLVIEKEVLDRVLEVIDQELFKKVLRDKNSRLRLYTIMKGSKAAFTVTDYFFLFWIIQP